MDRTEEMVSLFAIHGCSSWQEREKTPLVNPECHRLERSAAAHVRSNSALLQRMGKLIQRKEFSNDPTAELNEISESFQRTLVAIKRDLEALTGSVAETKRRGVGGGRRGGHSEQHWAHILSGLQTQVAADIATFQSSLLQHGQQVHQRQSRVTKFGQGSDQVRLGQATFPSASSPASSSQQQQQQQSSASGVVSSSSGYALFAPPPLHPPPGTGAGGGGGSQQEAPPRPSGRNMGVIRRRNHAGGGGSSSSSSSSSTAPLATAPAAGCEEVNNSKTAADKGRKKYFSVAFPSYSGGNGGQQDQLLQQQQQRRSNMHRSEQSKMVEESIGKMGQLFSQMSSLVLAQAETIQRIEDDVEAGQEDTAEAHADLVYVHEITKGNRGLIVKIFGLLVFFILLFMVWT